MSFRKNILEKYLEKKNIIHVIGHDPWFYLKLISRFTLILFLIFFIYQIIQIYLNNFVLSVCFGLIGIIIYVQFIISFLDIYLDSIILTNDGLVIFRWDGLFKYKSESIQWLSLNALNEEQNGLLDVFLNKGDLKIKRGDEFYIFKDVSHPAKQISTILSIKANILKPPPPPEPEEPEMDKFNILVETLGEVIVDYIKKNKK